MTLNINSKALNTSRSIAKSSANLPLKNTNSDSINFCGRALEIKNPKTINKINWLGDDFDSAMQRLVSGVTAILTQPFFDLNNKNTDEKTRKTSCARTMGKIIAGTCTGVLIREACIQAAKKFTQNENFERTLAEKAKESGKTYTPKTEFKAWQQCLLPDKMKKAATYREIKKYRGAVGTFAAVVIMIFTNFLVDAPLTTFLTNKFVKKMNSNSEQKAQNVAEGGK